MNRQTIDHIKLSKDGENLIILDQTQLPNRTVYIELNTAEEMYEAIKQLKVRGAPAIGVFAGFALYCLSLRYKSLSYDSFIERLKGDAKYLESSRPTAVNLSWALRRMVKAAEKHGRTEGLLDLLREESQAILDEDIAMCTAISEHGLSLLKEGDGILTHCNAGQLQPPDTERQ